MKKIKVLELYSGIGGLHYGLLQALINCINNCNDENIENLFHFISLDLNPIANKTYYHNFQENTVYLTNKKDINRFFNNFLKSKKNCERKIDSFSPKKPEGNCERKADNKEDEFNLNKNYIIQTDTSNLTVQFFNSQHFDILLISNPCQPYTRQNKNFKEINLNEIISKNNSIGGKWYKTKEESNKSSNTESDNSATKNYLKKNGRDIQSNENNQGNVDVLIRNKNQENHIYSDKNTSTNKNINNVIDTNSYNDRNTQQIATEICDQFSADNLNEEGIINSLHHEEDERTNSFIHICNLLQNMNTHNLPQYIFIENVKNFEVSSSFLYFIYSIKKNYNFQTYLLSPLQFGIPNERLRFYCICKRKDYLDKKEEYTSSEKTERLLYNNSLIPQRYISFGNNEKIIFYLPNIATYLDCNEKFPLDNTIFKNINIMNDNLNEFEIKKEILQKKSANCFDILDVNKNGNICCFDSNKYYVEKNKYINSIISSEKKFKINSKKIHSMCFTSNYGRYINGSGSILYFCKYYEKKKKKKKKTTNSIYNETLLEYKYEAQKEPENNILSSSNNEELSDSSNEHYSSEGFNETKYGGKKMSKYENKVRYFTPIEICRLMGFKMRTEKYNLKKNAKNTYGNIYWNIDHINHKCSYTYNTHYCDINNTNTCVLNSKEYVQIKNSNEEKKEKGKCFCHEFTFPPFLTNRQKHKLIGNSVNIIVISLILQIHNIFEDFKLENILH